MALGSLSIEDCIQNSVAMSTDSSHLLSGLSLSQQPNQLPWLRAIGSLEAALTSRLRDFCRISTFFVGNSQTAGGVRLIFAGRDVGSLESRRAGSGIHALLSKSAAGGGTQGGLATRFLMLSDVAPAPTV